MAQLDGQSTGGQLVMGCLQLNLFGIFVLPNSDARAHLTVQTQHVDLVEGHPVFHFIFIPMENCFADFR